MKKVINDDLLWESFFLTKISVTRYTVALFGFRAFEVDHGIFLSCLLKCECTTLVVKFCSVVYLFDTTPDNKLKCNKGTDQSRYNFRKQRATK